MFALFRGDRRPRIESPAHQRRRFATPRPRRMKRHVTLPRLAMNGSQPARCRHRGLARIPANRSVLRCKRGTCLRVSHRQGTDRYRPGQGCAPRRRIPRAGEGRRPIRSRSSNRWYPPRCVRRSTSAGSTWPNISPSAASRRRIEGRAVAGLRDAEAIRIQPIRDTEGDRGASDYRCVDCRRCRRAVRPGGVGPG